MQCPTCGHQNRADARFCDRCRSPLSPGGQAAAVPQQSQFNTQNAGPAGIGWQSPPTINQPLPVSPLQQPAASMPPSAPITPPIQYGKHGGFVGVVRNIQRSSEQGVNQLGYQQTTQILRFVLEQYDQGGNRTRVMSVEMRSLSIVGVISEGDWVEVFGKREGGLILAEQIQNLRTEALVETKKGIPTALKVFMVIAAIVVLIPFSFVVYLVVFQGILNPASNGPPPVSPDGVLSGYCISLRTDNTQGAYDQYSTKLKSQVSSQQLAQMWSGKVVGGCTYDSVQVSGNQATSTLYITASPIASPPNSGQTYTYHVILVRDGFNGWKIDSLQPR